MNLDVCNATFVNRSVATDNPKCWVVICKAKLANLESDFVIYVFAVRIFCFTFVKANGATGKTGSPMIFSRYEGQNS